MFKVITERLRQKKRTVAYPAKPPALPPRFRGRPYLAAELCARVGGQGCAGPCQNACPLNAIDLLPDSLQLDMGRCSFCGACAAACPQGAIAFTGDHRLAATRRTDLVIQPNPGGAANPLSEEALRSRLAQPLSPELLRLFSRSLRLRQVSAAGCNACEADINVLGTIVFDLPRFGIDMVASPRHADGLWTSGPLPRNMLLAAQKAWAVVPEPKLVIASGLCAISGGLFRDQPGYLSGQTAGGVEPHLAPTLYIPGCPPHPYTALDALLRLLGRLS